jgi:hypothetical protein
MRVYVRFSMLTACLLLAAATVIAPAQADDNGALYVAPGPNTLIPPDAIKRYQEQSAGSNRKLGDIIGNSLKSPNSHATDLEVTTQCGHYLSATITFANGVIKTLSLGNAPASKSDMEQAKAALPILRIVDLGNCDK